VEAAAVAILTRAIDFLFEQGAEILRSRRERKQRESTAATDTEAEPPPIPPPPAEPSAAPGDAKDAGGVVATRDELMQREIDRAMLERNEGEIRHLLTLQETHTKNYHLAREQYAQWGDALVPPIIVNNLEHEERALTDVMNKLRTKVEEVYGTRIAIPGLDEGTSA
jgi:hypothetical protein